MPMQEFVFKDSRLREGSYRLAHFKVNKSVLDLFVQIILFNNPLWE